MPRYPLQNYAGGIMGIGMRRDFQIALLCAAAAIPAGVAMIEAPEYFPVLNPHSPDDAIICSVDAAI